MHTATRNSTSEKDGLLESSPRTDCDVTRNSAIRRIHMTGSSQSQEEVTAIFTPEGKQRRDHPKITWQWMVEKEMQKMVKTWSSISEMGKDRQKCRDHATWCNGYEL